MYVSMRQGRGSETAFCPSVTKKKTIAVDENYFSSVPNDLASGTSAPSSSLLQTSSMSVTFSRAALSDKPLESHGQRESHGMPTASSEGKSRQCEGERTNEEEESVVDGQCSRKEARKNRRRTRHGEFVAGVAASHGGDKEEVQEKIGVVATLTFPLRRALGAPRLLLDFVGDLVCASATSVGEWGAATAIDLVLEARDKVLDYIGRRLAIPLPVLAKMRKKLEFVIEECKKHDNKGEIQVNMRRWPGAIRESVVKTVEGLSWDEFHEAVEYVCSVIHHLNCILRDSCRKGVLGICELLMEHSAAILSAESADRIQSAIESCVNLVLGGEGGTAVAGELGLDSDGARCVGFDALGVCPDRNVTARVVDYREKELVLQPNQNRRIQAMMHYKVSLRPFDAVVQLEPEEDSDTDDDSAYDEETEEGTPKLIGHANGSGSLSTEKERRKKKKKNSSQMLPRQHKVAHTPHSFPPSPGRRQRLLSEFSSFAEDVLFRARDELRSECAASLGLALGPHATFNPTDSHPDIVLSCGLHCAQKTGHGLYRSVRTTRSIQKDCLIYFQLSVSRDMSTSNNTLSTSTLPMFKLESAEGSGGDSSNRGNVALSSSPPRRGGSGGFAAQGGGVGGRSGDIPMGSGNLPSATVSGGARPSAGGAVTGGGGVIGSRANRASLCVGLSTRSLPLNMMVGASRFSIGFCSSGRVVQDSVWYPIQEGPGVGFGYGDYVGVLVYVNGDPVDTPEGKMVSASVRFTVGGRALGTPGHFINCHFPAGEEIFPTVSLYSSDTQAMSHLTAPDLLAPSRTMLGLPEHAQVFALDGSPLFRRLW